MHFKKRIGIWGYGVVGKAAAHFFSGQHNDIYIMDAQQEVAHQLKQQFPRAIFYKEELAATFFNDTEQILVSPGVDIRQHYATIKDKLISELDIFNILWQKPIIAVTGSVGKTSVVHFLTHLLQQYGIQAIAGGNIGRATFDLCSESQAQQAVVEVSSFQLEHTKSFAPHLAIWTTFAPNHLDRHGNQDEYFKAKYQILAHQTNNQKALLPYSIKSLVEYYKLPHHNISFFVDQPLDTCQLAQLSKDADYFAIDNNIIYFWHNGNSTELMDMKLLPPITFLLNWLIVIAALHILALDIQPIAYFAQDLTAPAHRLELIATHNGITYYNDSKATTVTATSAAIAQLSHYPIYLLLGGLGKGVDRTPFIMNMPKNVFYIACFGAEAEFLGNACQKAGIRASVHQTLEDAFSRCVTQAQTNSIVLLSPAGSSYDLFLNYEERGERFRQLVLSL